MSIWVSLLVFILAATVNFLNALYIKYVAENKILKAAIFSELVVIASSVATISYVNNPFYLLPMVVGGFLGTILSNLYKM